MTEPDKTAAAAEAAPAAEAAATPAAEAAATPAAEAAATPAAEAAATPAAANAADSRTTKITAGQGGVMTDEVGVITGELTLKSELAAGEVTVRVQYFEADEWYAVTGARAALKDPADLDAVHTVAVGILNRPEG